MEKGDLLIQVLIMVKHLFFLNIFVNTRGYPWIPADMKKIDGYLHNGYPKNMDTGTRRIFIQRVGYGGVTIHTLPAPLTSLTVIDSSLGLIHM